MLLGWLEEPVDSDDGIPAGRPSHDEECAFESRQEACGGVMIAQPTVGTDSKLIFGKMHKPRLRTYP
jgi:hypothetical protein